MLFVCRDCLEAGQGTGPACPACGGGRLVVHPELDRLGIAHIDCDAFYASVEKRDDPSLADQPLIVGHPGGRGVVTTACYIARTFGVRSAMPMFQAMRRCPQAVVIPPDMDKYRRVSQRIRALFRTASPRIEPLSLDEAYLDLSPGEHLLEGWPAVSLAGVARRIEQEVGITVSVGLADTMFLAKLASDLDKPRGFSVIGRAEAKGFLARLPVARIHGVGAVTARRMEDLGLTTIGQLQAMPEMRLVGLFGAFGRTLARHVQGDDDRRVTPDRPSRSISAETTFEADVRDLEVLKGWLWPLCRRVAERLARNRLAGRTVVLKLKTGDFHLLTRHGRLRFPTQRAETIYRQGLPLLAREADGRPFRLIGVGVGELGPPDNADPPDLFDQPRG